MGTDTTTEGPKLTIERFGDFNRAGITPERHWLRVAHREDGRTVLSGPILTDRRESMGLLVDPATLVRIGTEHRDSTTGSVGDEADLRREWLGDGPASPPTHKLASLSLRKLSGELWAEVVLLDTPEADAIASELWAVATTYCEGSVPPGFEAGESIVPAHFMPTLQAPDGKTKILSRLDITPARAAGRRFELDVGDCSPEGAMARVEAVRAANRRPCGGPSKRELLEEARRRANEELSLTVWITPGDVMHLRGVVLQEGVAAESGIVFSPEAVRVLAQTDLTAKPLYGGCTKASPKAAIQFERFALGEPSGILTGYARVLDTDKGRALKALLLSMTGLGDLAPESRPGNLARAFAKFSFCVQSETGNPESPVGPAVSFEAIDVTFFEDVHVGEKPRGEKLAESAAAAEHHVHDLGAGPASPPIPAAPAAFAPKRAVLRHHGFGHWTVTDLVSRGGTPTSKGYRFAPGFAARAEAAVEASGLSGQSFHADGTSGHNRDAAFRVQRVWSDGEDLYVRVELLTANEAGRALQETLKATGVPVRSWDSPPGTTFETAYRIELAFADKPPAVIPADFPIAGLRVAKSVAPVRGFTMVGAESAMRSIGEAFRTLSEGISAAGEAMLSFPDLRKLAGITDAELATMRKEMERDNAADARAAYDPATFTPFANEAVLATAPATGDNERDAAMLAAILRQQPRRPSSERNPCKEIPLHEFAASFLRRKPKVMAALLKLMPGRSQESVLAALEAVESDLWLSGALPVDRPGLALSLAVQLSDLGLLDVVNPSAAHRQLVALYAYVLGHGPLFEQTFARVVLAAPGEVFEGEGRVLSARWSPEALDDLRAMHGINAEAEVIAGAGEQIALELQREVLNAGVSVLRRALPDITWIAAAATPADSMRAVMLRLSDIGRDRDPSRRDDQHWFVVTGPEGLARLGMTEPRLKDGYVGLALVGGDGLHTFIWCDPFFPPDEILVGGIDENGPAGLEYSVHRLIELEAASWDAEATVGRRVRARGTVTVNPAALRLLKFCPVPKPDAERHDAD